MKKLFLLTLSVMFCVGSAAQNLPADSNVAQNSLFYIAQGFTSPDSSSAAIEKQIYPLGKGIFKKHHLELALEICPVISRSKVSRSELLQGENVEDISDSSYGMDGGASVIFTPGYEENGKLHLNSLGFSYSTGLLFSFSTSDRYGTLCDFMAKIGFEVGHTRKIGGGFDLLGGYGKAAGDVFFYENIVENPIPTSTVPYTAWVKKFGGQIWIKTGLLGNSLTNTDVLIFVRLIKAFDPGLMVRDYSLFHHNLWRNENWSFGIILRYRP